MKKLILALSCCALVAVACTPEEATQPIDASKARMLKDGSWQLKAYILIPDIAAEIPMPQDVYIAMPGCQKDDYIVFNNDYVLSIYQGLTKCNITDPDSVVYQYTLENDEKFLRVWANPDDPDNSVLMAGDVTYPSVDSFIMTYIAPSVADPDVSSRHTMTFVKQ